MNRFIISLSVLLFCTVLRAEYKLVWSDEFDSLNHNVWTHETGTGDNGWGNYEQETYTDSPANSFVDSSILNICAIRIPDSSDRVQYTSARLKTQGNVSILYGKIEARMKLPQRGQGVWPAFWMLGESIVSKGWPYCGEIDIMEWKGSQPNSVISTSHWNGNQYSYEHCNYGNTLALDFPLDEKFYVYGVEWTPSLLEYYMVDDNGQKHTINVIDISVANDVNGLSCFHKPAFILLNLAMGGQFDGDVAPNLGNRTFQIDWVRVYQDLESYNTSMLINNSQSKLQSFKASDDCAFKCYRSNACVIVESHNDGKIDVFSYDGKIIFTRNINAGTNRFYDIPCLSIIRFRK